MFAIRVVEVFVCVGAVMNGGGGSLRANEKDGLGECGERERILMKLICAVFRENESKHGVEGSEEDETLYGLPCISAHIYIPPKCISPSSLPSEGPLLFYPP